MPDCRFHRVSICVGKGHGVGGLRADPPAAELWLQDLADTIRCGAYVAPCFYVRMIQIHITRVLSSGSVTS
jgi:hypothetical protein